MDDYSKAYLDNYEMERFQVKARIKNLTSLSLDLRNKKILEVGIGTESFCTFFFGYRKWDIVEPNPTFKSDFLNFDLERISIYQSKLEDYKVNTKYDIIIISGLLHMIDDLSVFLKRIIKLSKIDTIVYLNVPNANSLHRLVARNLGIIKTTSEFSLLDHKFNHKRVFDMTTLINEISSIKRINIIKSGSYFLKFLTNEQYTKAISYGIVEPDYFDALIEVSNSQIEEFNFGSEIYLLFSFVG